MVEHWIPLEALRQGAVFETRTGLRALKTDARYALGSCECVLHENGTRLYFDTGGGAAQHNATEVRELSYILPPLLPLERGDFRKAEFRASAAPWPEAREYICDNRDSDDLYKLSISMGGNGDWYVSVLPKDDRWSRATVRLCTSGGAISAVPGLVQAVCDAYRALGGEIPTPPMVNPFADLLGEEDPRIAELEAEAAHLTSKVREAWDIIHHERAANDKRNGEKHDAHVRALADKDAEIARLRAELTGKV